MSTILVQTHQTHRMSYVIDGENTDEGIVNATEKFIYALESGQRIDPLTSALVSEQIVDVRSIDAEEIHNMIRETNDVFGS